MNILTPVKAIRKKCLDCTGEQPREVRLCPITNCPIYPYRMGRRPKPGDMEQEAKKSELAPVF